MEQSKSRVLRFFRNAGHSGRGEARGIRIRLEAADKVNVASEAVELSRSRVWCVGGFLHSKIVVRSNFPLTMLYERDVIDAVCYHLQTTGHTIKQRLRPNRRGDDRIVAN